MLKLTVTQRFLALHEMFDYTPATMALRSVFLSIGTALTGGAGSVISSSAPTAADLVLLVGAGLGMLIAGNAWWWMSLRRRQRALVAEMELRNRQLASAREETRRSQDLLQGLVDNLPMPLWAIDADGHLILQNRHSITAIGDHRGHRLDDLPLASQIIQPWQDAVASGLLGQTALHEHWQDLGSGDPRRMQVRIAPVRRNAALIAVVGAHLDITERFRTDEIPRRRHRMVTLGELTRGVAHDFNNLLAGIHGYADLITSRSHDEQAHGYAGKICATVSRAQALTARLLAFARHERVRRDVYDAHAAISAAIDLFSTTNDRDLVVVSALRAERSQVRGFADLLENAILNLCLNAGDAMPSKGGQVHIASSVCTVDSATARSLRPYAANPGEFLHITVSDTGLGMEPEVMAQCLEPLFTTKGDRGTGLGLPNVHACVLDHHGALRIDTAPAQGTVVHLWLPLSEPWPSSEPPPLPEEPESTRSNPRRTPERTANPCSSAALRARDESADRLPANLA